MWTQGEIRPGNYLFSLKGEMIGKLTLITTEIISEAAALD